jgi:hypothetical protein
MDMCRRTMRSNINWSTIGIPHQGIATQME